jgi:hypothetical protein
MANGMYAKNVTKFLTGGLTWSGNVKACLIHVASYTVNLATNQFLSDIPGGAIVATSPNLTGVTTFDDGVADADDPTFASVTGSSAEAMVLYQDTGVAGTSNLYIYFDTLQGLPVTPNGTNVVVQFANDTSRVFQI